MPVDEWNDPSRHFMMVLSSASALATKAHEEAGTDHFLLAIDYQNGPLWRAVRKELELDTLPFRSHIESFVDAHSEAATAGPVISGQVTPEFNAVFSEAFNRGKERGDTSEVNVGTLLLALANEKAGRIERLFGDYGVNIATFRNAVERHIQIERDEL